MAEQAPAWLTALTIVAPIFASFGVLWLTNRQQSRNLRAQHELALEKDKISAAVQKAEQLYSDIQKWKKYIELWGFQHVAHYQMASSANAFLSKVTEDQPSSDFDLVRLELNLRAYFPELEDKFRGAEKLVHASGKLQADMVTTFDAATAEKKKLSAEYLSAQKVAIQALDELSAALAGRIGLLMKLRNPA